MSYRKEADGYKCAACGEDQGDFIPDGDCWRCGCMTSEVKYIYIQLDDNGRDLNLSL